MNISYLSYFTLVNIFFEKIQLEPSVLLKFQRKMINKALPGLVSNKFARPIVLHRSLLYIVLHGKGFRAEFLRPLNGKPNR